MGKDGQNAEQKNMSQKIMLSSEAQYINQLHNLMRWSNELHTIFNNYAEQGTAELDIAHAKKARVETNKIFDVGRIAYDRFRESKESPKQSAQQRELFLADAAKLGKMVKEKLEPVLADHAGDIRLRYILQQLTEQSNLAAAEYNKLHPEAKPLKANYALPKDTNLQAQQLDEFRRDNNIPTAELPSGKVMELGYVARRRDRNMEEFLMDFSQTAYQMGSSISAYREQYKKLEPTLNLDKEQRKAAEEKNAEIDKLAGYLEELSHTTMALGEDVGKKSGKWFVTEQKQTLKKLSEIGKELADGGWESAKLIDQVLNKSRKKGDKTFSEQFGKLISLSNQAGDRLERSYPEEQFIPTPTMYVPPVPGQKIEQPIQKEKKESSLTSKEQALNAMNNLRHYGAELSSLMTGFREAYSEGSKEYQAFTAAIEKTQKIADTVEKHTTSLQSGGVFWNSIRYQEDYQKDMFALGELADRQLRPLIDLAKQDGSGVKKGRFNQLAQELTQSANRTMYYYNAVRQQKDRKTPYPEIPNLPGQESAVNRYRKEQGIAYEEGNTFDKASGQEVYPDGRKLFKPLKAQIDSVFITYDGSRATDTFDSKGHAKSQCEVIEGLSEAFSALESGETLENYAKDHPIDVPADMKQNVKALLNSDAFKAVREDFKQMQQAVSGFRSDSSKTKERSSLNVINSMSVFQQSLNQWKKGLSDREAWQVSTVFSHMKSPQEKNGLRDSVSLNDFLFENPMLPETKTVRVKDSDFTPKSHNRMTEMKADDSIFPNGGPKPEDVVQNNNGACYMLSILRSMAEHPEKIRDLIEDNGDGTVTVHFYDDKKTSDDPNKNNYVKQPMDVVIDKSLPKVDGFAAPWVRLVEKAYVASQLKTMCGRGGFERIEGIDMKKLGWDFSSSFIDNITPTKAHNENVSEKLLQSGSFGDAKNEYIKILKDAVNSGATISISTEKHAMQFKNIEEKNGKTYVNYYDQMFRTNHSVPMEDVFSPKGVFESIDICYPDRTYDRKIYSLSPLKDAKECASRFNYISKADFRDIARSQISNDFKEYGVSALISNSGAARKALDEAYKSFEGRYSVDGLREKLRSDPELRTELREKLVAGMRPELQKKNDTAALQMLDNLKEAEPKKEKEVKEKNALQEAADFEKLKKCYETIHNSGKGKSNSPEFTAMESALRDVCEVMELGDKVSKETVQTLQERAFAKCNFYFRNKDPKTQMGQQRKNAAESAMGALRGLHSDVSNNLYHANKKAVTVELACQYIEKSTEAAKSMELQQTVSRQRMFEEMFGGKANEEMARINKLAQSMPSGGTGWGFYEKTCQKGVAEAMQKLTSAANAGGAKDAKQQKSREKEMQSASKKLGIPAAPKIN